MADDGKLSKIEGIKENSDFLRGTIDDELAADELLSAPRMLS